MICSVLRERSNTGKASRLEVGKLDVDKLVEALGASGDDEVSHSTKSLCSYVYVESNFIPS